MAALAAQGCGSDDGGLTVREPSDGTVGGDITAQRVKESELACACLGGEELRDLCMEAAWPEGRAECLRNALNERSGDNQPALACLERAGDDAVACLQKASCNADAVSQCHLALIAADDACPALDAETEAARMACLSDTPSPGDDQAGFYGVEAITTAAAREHELSKIVSHLGAADFDEDGLVDLIVGQSNAAPGEDRLIFLSSRGGLDAEPVAVGCEEQRCDYAPLVGDINGDKHADLVAAYGISDESGVHDDTRVRVHLGDGQGGFSAPVFSSLPLVFGSAVSLSDEDGDGAFDLVVSAARSPACHRAVRAAAEAGASDCSSDAQCTNGQTCQPSMLGGDAKFKKYCADPCTQAAMVRADASGVFTAVWTVPVAGSVTALDVDADGDTDLSVAAADPNARLLRNTGTGFEAASAAFEHPAAVLDFDADQVGDLYYQDELAFMDDGMASAPVRLVPEGMSASRLSVSSTAQGPLFSQHVLATADRSELVAFRIEGRKPRYVMRVRLDDGFVAGGLIADLDGDDKLDVVYAGLSDFSLHHVEQP